MARGNEIPHCHERNDDALIVDMIVSQGNNIIYAAEPELVQ